MNSNLIAVISDLHFGLKKNSDIWFNSQKRFIKHFISILKEKNINTIFILGDIFDNRNSINTKIQNDVFYLFNDDLKDFIIYILVGNHDCYFNNSTEINSIKFLNKFKNVNIIEKTKLIDFKNRKILLVPWITDFSKFIQEINSIGTFDISLGHYNIRGFHYNKNKISEDGLDANIFKNKCKCVLSGHFHTRSKQSYDGYDIIYIGAPYQITRADMDEERGFIIFDIDNLTYEYINNEVSIKFIKLNFPDNFSEDQIKGNHIDVHIKVNDKNYSEKKVENYINAITEFNPAFPPQILIETDEMLGANFEINKFNLSSITDLMMEYINSIDIQNKDEIFNILTELYDLTTQIKN